MNSDSATGTEAHGQRPSSSFEGVFAQVDGVDGWLSEGQARRLWSSARKLGSGGQIVEIGSYRGRSAIVLALAAPTGSRVVAIDPHAGNDRGPQQWEGTSEEGENDNRLFNANLERAGVTGVVRHVRAPSQGALGEVDGEVSLLYVDGAHRYRPALADIQAWGARVAPGGTMLIHDGFSSVGVTLALMRELFASRRWAYRGRTGSLVEYERVDAGSAALLANCGRQVAQLPWFVRNLIVKLALVAHAWPLARALGHRDRNWPY